MRNIREGGLSQVKKRGTQGGDFHKKKKGRLAIHKIEGFKRRWISQGGRIHIVPLFPIFPWYIITFSICPNYSDVGFPFVHFCGTVFSPLLETWISPFGLDFFPFSNKSETFPYRDPFCPLVMGPAGRLGNNCGAVACRDETRCESDFPEVG